MGNLFRILLFVLIPLPFVLGQGGNAKTRERVYVIAVKTTGDSSAFRPCPRYLSGYRPPPYRAPELFSSAKDVVPAGIPDDAIKARVENEFRRQKKYDVVDSVEDADIVFFVQANYFAWIDMSIAATPMPPDMSRSGGSLPASGATQIFAGYPDEKPNVLGSAIAVASTADSYRLAADNGAALLKSAIWQGMLRGINDQSVKPEALVSQFQSRRKPDPKSPLCAAPQPVHAPAASGGVFLSIPKGPNRANRDAFGAGDATASGAVIQVDVDFVSVPVIVTDKEGRYVPDLKPSDFQVYEDGVEQKIDRMIPETDPFNIVLLLDTSHSTQNNFDEIRHAALTFIQSVRPDDRVMVISFNDRVYVDAELTGDRDRLIEAVSQVRSGPNTRLYDALHLALSERLRQVRGRKAIVLFTDGVDTVSGLANENSTIAEVEEADTAIYVVQYDTITGSLATPPMWKTGKAPDGFKNRNQLYAQGAAYLERLAEASGGALNRAESASAVHDAFLQVARELVNQYAICYYPTNKARDGSLRRIRVTVNRPEIKVRARTGYRPARNSGSR